MDPLLLPLINETVDNFFFFFFWSDSSGSAGRFPGSSIRAGIISVFALTVVSVLTHLPCTQHVYQTCVLRLSEAWVLKFPIPKGQCLWGKAVYVWFFLLHGWNRLRLVGPLQKILFHRPTYCFCYSFSLPCWFHAHLSKNSLGLSDLPILSPFHKLPSRKEV